ncbi:hypothetical protein SPI02_16480 [Staphylococcus piscifermentans]|uniref:Uncharacterized protein n=1 Tax=Staphylococcus piscifermentans TaxID=70258 RepID=A0A512QNN3_9STAP|nr:hypothetical protein SPI02_16480 [Staphylococcus piscifermentans]
MLILKRILSFNFTHVVYLVALYLVTHDAPSLILFFTFNKVKSSIY